MFCIEQCLVNDCIEFDGIGIGFLISVDGFVFIVYYVVFQVFVLSVCISNGNCYLVKVVGYDDQNDFVVIWVSVLKGMFFFLLVSSMFKFGDVVFVIGNGGGEYLWFKVGCFMVLCSEVGCVDFFFGILEFSVLLVFGDSGGFIINCVGEVVGVVSYVCFESIGECEEDVEVYVYVVLVIVDDICVVELWCGVKWDVVVIGISLEGEWSLFVNLFEQVFVESKLGKIVGVFFICVVFGSLVVKVGL